MTRYLADARWFGGKGRDYDVVDVQRVATMVGPPVVTIDVLTVRYADGGVELYQMPLSHYPEPQERIQHAYLGAAPGVDPAVAHTYDAVHDREAMAVYLETFDDTPANASVELGGLTFHRLAGHELDTEAHSTLFSGEQSNSSVAFGDDSLLKVFRKVTPGRNPDIEIHAALTRAENPNVAALYGWVEGSTTDGRLDLAMIQQFLRTASDGWDLALSSVRNLFAEADLHADEVGGDFAGEAERLGAAVAEVHQVLREHFGSASWSGREVAAAMGDRLTAQIEVAPALAEHADALRGVYDALAALGEDDSAQRIHGDLHLGQTLRVVHNWKLVDFEGEPAKTLADRVLPDNPWRDVAGMLRSLDYAARAVERDFAFESASGQQGAADQLSFRAQEWTRRNRQAFLTGYLQGREMSPAEQTLVAAYEADKAVYEVGYETRNRPTWVSIPLGALTRLAEGAAR
ncbi:hypothetical protein D9V37_03915 [Nocardioides mangrovicus]|uniref:Maltokinase n=1 Tax=Nocardioides mangrovicus TaxID=2478913 RepID=A0A3L8P7F6_9ACTN|nr:hypothetical protein [Nocardioides mangrovicus]RLV51074.1 hypothetical protein D9V37_03915 [Nocardioides mangrovicus]